MFFFAQKKWARNCLKKFTFFFLIFFSALIKTRKKLLFNSLTLAIATFFCVFISCFSFFSVYSLGEQQRIAFYHRVDGREKKASQKKDSRINFMEISSHQQNFNFGFCYFFWYFSLVGEKQQVCLIGIFSLSGWVFTFVASKIVWRTFKVSKSHQLASNNKNCLNLVAGRFSKQTFPWAWLKKRWLETEKFLLFLLLLLFTFRGETGFARIHSSAIVFWLNAST